MKQQLPKVELLSINQVASMLNVSSKTVRRMIDRSDLHHHRVGRAVRISSEDLQAYANSIRR